MYFHFKKRITKNIIFRISNLHQLKRNFLLRVGWMVATRDKSATDIFTIVSQNNKLVRLYITKRQKDEREKRGKQPV